MFLLETFNLKNINAGFHNSLKSGASVVFTVNKKTGSNLYQIFILGKFLNIKSENNLKPGTKMRAQVFWINDKLQLKVLDTGNTDLKVGSIKNNLFSDPITQMITDGLIRSNMPLDPSYIKKLETILRKNKEQDHKLLKILLLMIDKGIPVNDRNVEEILSLSDKNSDSRSGKFNQNQNRKKTDTKNKESIVEDIKKQIKKTDTGRDLIKYFNHKIAKHDNWLIIPINYSYKRAGKGVLKIRLNEKLIITNLVLSLSDGNDWEFNIISKGTKRMLKVSGPKDLLFTESLSFIKLKEKLYNMGIIYDDINIERSVTDGFTNVQSMKYERIDLSI